MQEKESGGGRMEHAKLIRGERWSWKVTPCVWSPRIRCPVGRHARTMLIFKSLGCLFKVSNWYLPLEEFPPIWHRVWEQGASSLPCLPAVGVCYATGNTLARPRLPTPCFFGVHCDGSTRPHRLPLFYGFRLRIPTVAAKLPIIETFNKQAEKCNAFVWFGTTVETLSDPFFRTPKNGLFEASADISIWKYELLLEGSWRFGSSNTKRSLTELLCEFIFWITPAAAAAAAPHTRTASLLLRFHL